jgi:RNA polymerase sigma factor (sigma-70 family)
MNHPVLHVLALGKVAEVRPADRTDGQLLDSFIRSRDEAAFAAVVRRHAAMVLAVCRRVLGNHADAEDAFQATFLVLARKAKALGLRRPLGPWLHGVAFNTARRARRANRRRAGYERTVVELPEIASEEPVRLSDELLTILDEELARLPERYRAPIVLCDLEGLTRREAASQLGCPEGTVAGRLARARLLLAARIANRGVVPSAGILSLLLTQRVVGAATPARINPVARAACGGPVPVRVSCLVERVVAAMLFRKLKSAAAVVLLCGLLAAAAMGLRSEASAGPEPAFLTQATSAKSVSAAEKVLTVVPLRKLNAVETAAVITDAFKGKGIIVAPIPDERSILLYADARTTREIQAHLIKLGEPAGKTASGIGLAANVDCRETARVLREVFNGPKASESSRVTIVPVPAENAILVYAAPNDILTVRSLLGALDQKPVPAGRVERIAGRDAKVPEGWKEPKKYAVAFRDTPWAEVLEWYARESGLTLVSTVKPTGNVTIASPKDRKFTFGEITDLINESLMAQKYILVRGETTFFLHPADERIDPTKVPRIELGELKQRGKTELVQVVIPFKADAQDDLAQEVRKLLSPFGNATRVKNTLVILDTAGIVTRIHELLQKIYPGNKDPNDREATSIDFDRDGWPDIVLDAQPELRRYAVAPGTADALAKALLAINPKLRCIAVQAANQVWVMATPQQHAALASWFKLIPPRKETATGK